ncbi:MAG TPA: biotin/lipoyl-containing protein, partial [Pseudomonadales bacterium]|nr:biotin/lipoyl-containing protein [Pseudomonadales bacterium]
LREIQRIGFPVMIKASAGGGGRGMRLVFSEQNLLENIRSARSEAQNAFGSGELILERAIHQPRHIEIQIFADQHGNYVYLGERDCSVQRRHQKVVEEAPSPAVSVELRKKMGEAAIQAARSVNYVGAGTVEFLLDQSGEFYFLEMNTRLQVEHPVTELITGQDLVAWQIKIAAGERLPLSQTQIQLNGHAIEVRLYAEDPCHQFLPQTGIIHYWRPSQQSGIRIDHGVIQGNQVGSHYDPMLAKIIAYGADRTEAIRRLKRAVEETYLLGVKTNKAFLADILGHEKFIAGHATTAFISEHMAASKSLNPASDNAFYARLAAVIFSAGNARNQCVISMTRSHKMKINAQDIYAIQLEQLDETRFRSADDELQVLELTANFLRYRHNAVIRSLYFAQAENTLFLDTPHGQLDIENITYAPPQKADSASDGRVTAPMDGVIVNVLVEQDMSVEKGQTVAILEAMKIEHPLRAGINGKIKLISAQPGQQVKNRQVLIQIVPHSA